MSEKKLNIYFGWFAFLIATVVYFITIEDTVSLWDCGEYITAAYKLEVGHPPGAPLFMILGRLFSFFAEPENVAVWINRLSAVSSSLTILFMFWTLKMLIRKMMMMTRTELSKGDMVAMFGGAFIGAMAYTFTDSFWFSAVEGEVYAMSSLFTAVIFWAALKWDEEMIEVQRGRLQPKGFSPDRWLLLIMFLLGLAIGVHLLGILVVPAICYLVYFRYRTDSPNRIFGIIGALSGAGAVMILLYFTLSAGGVSEGGRSAMQLIAKLLVLGVAGIALYRNKEAIFSWRFGELLGVGAISIILLGFIQKAVIPGSISLASTFETGFVNALGLPFYSGTIFFFVVLVAGCIFLLRYTRKKGRRIFFSSVMGLTLLMIGYGSFAVIVIRSNANPPLDENDPENLVTLYSYLQREQYGSAPLATGQYWNSTLNPDRTTWGDHSPFYLRRFVVQKGDSDVKAFRDEARANEYAKAIPGASVVEKYYESNAKTRIQAEPNYEQKTLFPRMYWSQDPHKVKGYKDWSGYDPKVDAGTDIGSDGNRLPTFGENLNYFYSYQVDWMYWRYFMWNFGGRQNDIQGHGSDMRGNWISGFSFLDERRVGSQEYEPYYTSENPSNNKFFLLPFILGVIGMIFHFYRAPNDAFVVLLAFLFTGLAIVVYLNQKPFEPRERDYAYAGSFYFFALWIGTGTYALYEAFRSFGKKELTTLGVTAGISYPVFLIFGAQSGFMTSTIFFFLVFGIAALLIGCMVILKRVTTGEVQGASITIVLAAIVPVILAMQGWNDHDRSLKTTARDLAMNYLNSCGQNGIIFTNGDNDTFPLWYMQEVEEQRTDVRVCNLSLMQTDWYTEQMKMKAYDSDPLPIKFTEDQILMYAGSTDQILFANLFELFYGSSGIDLQAKVNVDPEVLKRIIAMRAKTNPRELASAIERFTSAITAALGSARGSAPQVNQRLDKIKQVLGSSGSSDVVEDVYRRFKLSMEILAGFQNQSITLDQAGMKRFQDALFALEDGWKYVNLQEAMEFTREDKNLINFNGQTVRLLPSDQFILPVNPENAVQSGLISEEQKGECLEVLRFEFSDRSLTREEVMMLDILANNDWKRGIYFSSPGGSSVSMALYRRGYIKQNGMAFEVSPLNMPTDRFNADVMYDNLMNNYTYGQMNNPNVLTDYYARRHTTQYRTNFLSLSEEYLRKAFSVEEDARRKAFQQAMVAGEMEPPAVIDLSTEEQKEVEENKKRAIALIHRSLEVMPAEFVIDHGEPDQNRVPEDNYRIGQQEIRSYKDGLLHEYVGVLLMAGDKEGAEKLGNTVAGQLESVLLYFEKTKNVANAVSGRNRMDLYSAMDAYLKLYTAAMDTELGNPDGALAKRTGKYVQHIFGTMIPSMKDRLKELANDNGESTRSKGSGNGYYAKKYFDLEEYSEAMKIHFGLVNPATGEPKP